MKVATGGSLFFAMLLVLPLGLYSATASAQSFSGEQALGVAAESEPVLWHRYRTVVFDGENYVALWQEDRQGMVPFGSDVLLLAARVSQQGELLDPHDILVSRSAASEAFALARAPWGSLILYETQEGLVAQRMNRAGELLDAEPLVLSREADVFPLPTAACSDVACYVTWNVASETRGVALDGCGQPIVGTELSLPGGKWQHTYSQGTHLLLGRRLQGYFSPDTSAYGIGERGTVLWGPQTLPISNSGFPVVSASAPDRFLVVWSDPTPDALDLKMVGLDLGGALIGQPKVLLQNNRYSAGDLAWEANHFRLTLQDSTAISALRFDPAGILLDPAPVEFSQPDVCSASWPRLASGVSNSLLIWDWGHNGPACQLPPPTAALVEHQAAEPQAPLQIVGSAARMGPPALGTDGNGYLAAWYEERLDATGLYTQRLASDGTAIEEPVLTITAEPHPAPARRASVSYVAGRYLVELAELATMWPEWAEPSVVATVSPDTGERGEAIPDASTGTPGLDGFLVVNWIVRQSGEDVVTLKSVTISIVDANGQLVMGQPTWINPDGSGQSAPFAESDERAVAGFDGQNYALIWRRWETPSAGDGRTYGVVFMPFDSMGVPVLQAPAILSGLDAYTPLAVTFGSDAYLLVLLDGESRLSAVRVSPQGAMLDDAPIQVTSLPIEGPYGPSPVSVTFDGNQFLIAYDARPLANTDAADAGTDPFGLGPTGPAEADNVELFVAAIGADGQLSSNAVVVSGPHDEIQSSLASLGDGTALLGYHRFEPSDAVSVRAYVRQLGVGDCTELVACGEACNGSCCAVGCPPPAAQDLCTATLPDAETLPVADAQPPDSGSGRSATTTTPPVAATSGGCAFRNAPIKNRQGFLLGTLVLGLVSLYGARRRASAAHK